MLSWEARPETLVGSNVMANHGLEQTVHRLRQDFRILDEENRLRGQCARAAAQAECSTDATFGLDASVSERTALASK